MEKTPASSFKLRAAAPEGRKRFPINKWRSLLTGLNALVLLGGDPAVALDLAPSAGAPAVDPSGVVQLRLLDPSLTASNVAIALANGWVNPSSSGQPASKFYYVNAGTVTQTAPGGYDGHASTVSAAMVGKGTGGNPLNWQNSMAPGIGAFYSYSDGDLINYNIMGVNPLAGGVRIVSQPFGLWGAAWGYTDLTNEKLYAQMYDNFAAAQNVLFVSSSGGASQSPASMYNGLCVDTSTTPNGPTFDGRVYKHLYYPVGTSSAAAGSIGGEAAVLLQAATRGDGGAGTATAASDIRTLKALILNGATKDIGWSNSSTVPLDVNQGAGMANVFNSYTQLAGGKLAPGTMSSLAGWDLRSLTSAGADANNSYNFSLKDNPMFPSITLASTIVWNRQYGQTDINHLTLELYNADTGAVVPGAASLSTVDNLQMIYLPTIEAGNYQLRVNKLFSSGQVSADEIYALAFSASGSYNFYKPGDQVWSNPISGSLPVIKSAPGLLTLTGSNSYTGGTIITTGTLRAGSAYAIGSGKVSVDGALDLAGQSISVESLSGSGQIFSSGTGNVSIGLNLVYNLFENTTFTGQISDGSAKVGLTVLGDVKQVQVLGGSNTYSGKTVIGGGQLSVSSLNLVVGGTDHSSLGAPQTVEDGVIDIGSSNSAGTLLYTGTGETTDRVINLTGSASLNQSGSTGLLKFTSDLRATAAGSKILTLAGSTAAMAEIAGSIVNGSGTTGVTKSSSGTWILSGSNIYTGKTTISGGVLRADNAFAIPGGLGTTGGTSALVFNGGVLGLAQGDFTRSLAATTNASGVNFTGAGGWAAYGADRVVNLGGNSATITWATANTGLNAKTLILSASNATHMVDFQNSLDLGSSSRTVQVDDGAAAVDARMSGSLIGTGGLNKTGAGMLRLSAANSYTGATSIAAGGIIFASQSALYGSTQANWTPSSITIESGGALVLGVGDSAAGYFDAAAIGTFLDSTHMGLSTTTTGFKTGASFGFDTSNVSGGTFTYSPAITNIGTSVNGFVKAGTGTLILPTACTYTGTTMVMGGTLQLGSGISNVSLSSTTVLLSNNANLTYNNPASSDFNVATSITGNGSLNVTSGANTYLNNNAVYDTTGSQVWNFTKISGTNSGLNVYSNGKATLRSGGNISVTGYVGSASTTLPGSVTYDTSAGNGNITLQTASGVSGISNRLNYQTINAGNGKVTLSDFNNNPFYGAYSATTITAGALDSSATLSMGTLDMTLNSPSVSSTWSGLISTSGNLIQRGAGTLFLSNANTFTGTTTLYSGTLVAANRLALQNSLFDTGTGSGTLKFNDVSPVLGGLTGSAHLASRMGGYASFTDLTLNTQTGANYSYSGNITDGAPAMRLIKSGLGTQGLAGTNTYTGETLLSAGVLRLDSANALPGGIGSSGGSSALTFNGGVLGLGAGDFTRSLAAAGTVSGANFTGTGGWAAYGADRVVNLGGNSAVITWSAANTGFNGQTLILGASTATHMLDFQNSINLGNAARTIQVDDGAASVDGRFSGNLSGIGGALTKTGAGVLSLSGSNSYTGVTTLSAGVVRLDSADALPGGTGTSGGISALTFNGGVLGLASDDFTRSLAAAGTVTGANFTGAGGWAAYGADRIVNLGGNATPSKITWATANTGLNGKTLILSASNATHMVDFLNPLDLGSSSRTVQVDDGAATVDARFSGIISGTTNGGLIKTGSGLLALAAANSYIDSTTISAGVLRLDNANALPGGIGTSGGLSALTFNGGVLGLASGDFTRSLAAAGTPTGVTFSSNGGWAAYGADRVVNLGGSKSSIDWGTVSTGLNGKTLILGASTATHMVDFQNPLVLGTSARTVQVNDGAATVDGKLSGNLSGAGGGLTKTGAGLLALAGSNSYTGVTTLSAGVLRLDSSDALPGGTGSSGGVSALTFNGGVLGLASGDFNRSLARAGTVSAANFTGAGGWAAYGADRVVNLGGSGASITWATSNTGLNGKTLILSDSTATHMVDFQNPLDLGNAMRTVQVNDGTAAIDAKLSGNLSGAGGGLTKTGAGALTLSGSNSYTGATNVSSGTLLVSGSLMGTTSVSVSSGAELKVNGLINTLSTTTISGGILSGSGALGAIVINNGGTVSPGNSPGTLTVTSASFDNGSIIKLELSNDKAAGGVPGTDWDRLAVLGALDLSGVATGGLTLSIQNYNYKGPWDGSVNHTFDAFMTFETIKGFSADKCAFDVDSAFFTGSGTWSVVKNSNQLDLQYMAIPEPAS